MFDHSHAMMATTMATTTICQNNPEKFLSFSEIRIRRDGGRAGFSVVTAQASSWLMAMIGGARSHGQYFICCNSVQDMKQMFHGRQTIALE